PATAWGQCQQRVRAIRQGFAERQQGARRFSFLRTSAARNPGRPGAPLFTYMSDRSLSFRRTRTAESYRRGGDRAWGKLTRREGEGRGEPGEETLETTFRTKEPPERDSPGGPASNGDKRPERRDDQGDLEGGRLFGRGTLCALQGTNRVAAGDARRRFAGDAGTYSHARGTRRAKHATSESGDGASGCLPISEPGGTALCGSFRRTEAASGVPKIVAGAG